MNNVVKSEEDTTCSGKQVEKNIRLDLSDIPAGTIGKANVTGIEIVNNETQDVIFNGNKVATISDKGIDFHIPVAIDGVKVGKFMVDGLRRIDFKETRTRGVV